MHRRHVDDIIYLFNCESEADKFFEFLNIQHPNIKFTFEKQVNKPSHECPSHERWRLIFALLLSVKIGWFTNYLGFTTFFYKVQLVRALLHCAFMISSSWFLFHEEVLKIKRYLEKNSL